MAITDIDISETLETNAPSIRYRGNEGPKSPEEQMQMAGSDRYFKILEFMINELEGELGRELTNEEYDEVGRRALRVRDLNRIRMKVKNDIIDLTGNGFKDCKMNYAGSDE